MLPERHWWWYCSLRNQNERCSFWFRRKCWCIPYYIQTSINSSERNLTIAYIEPIRTVHAQDLLPTCANPNVPKLPMWSGPQLWSCRFQTNKLVLKYTYWAFWYVREWFLFKPVFLLGHLEKFLLLKLKCAGSQYPKLIQFSSWNYVNDVRTDK